MTACSLLAIGLVSFLPNATVAGVLAGVVAVIGLICLYALIMVITGHVRWSRYQKDVVQKAQEALHRGLVEVKKVTAVSVIKIAEAEDEGLGYLFDVGDGKTLFLNGQQYFMPAEANEDEQWPNTDFELVRSDKEHLWLGIFCCGQKLEPSAVIESTEWKDDLVWAEREDVLEGTPESVVKTLLKPPLSQAGKHPV